MRHINIVYMSEMLLLKDWLIKRNVKICKEFWEKNQINELRQVMKEDILFEELSILYLT